VRIGLLTIHVLGVAMLLGGGLYTSFSFKGVAGTVGAEQVLVSPTVSIGFTSP